MKTSWIVAFWLLLLAGGFACMGAFAYGAWAYLGWWGAGSGAAAGELSLSELTTLLLLMPAGLFWMGAIFPAMQIHDRTRSRAPIYLTVTLLLGNLLSLALAAFYI